MREFAMRPVIAIALLLQNQVVWFDDLTNCGTWIGVTRHRRVLQNDTAEVFARHRAAVRAKGWRILRRDRVSHETLASVSCFAGTCSSSRFRRACLLPCPIPLILGVLQEVGLCDRNRNISRRCFDVFHKVDPEFVLLFFSLTHCCYGLPPYRNSIVFPFSSSSRDTFILSSECLGTL